MTAVLSPFDSLRSNKYLTTARLDMPHDTLSTDAEQDWKAKYEEVCETLAETEADLAEFQVSSKELEEEMGIELERAEKAQSELKGKVTKLEGEREEWKSKFMSLQSTHTTTVNSLQRELEALRESNRMVKIQLRELEMGNDDLERHDRAVVSSLEDLEGKYSRALEEKILLEHELQDKASMEEDMQRLRDELRDAQNEVSVLHTQLERAETAPKLDSPPLDDLELALSGVKRNSFSSMESLLEAPLPSASDELLLSDLTPTESNGHVALLAHAGFSTPKTGITRSTTLPSLSSSSPSRLPAPSPRRPLSTNISNNAAPSPTPIRPLLSKRTTTNATTSVTLTSRSKGMQMVSDMRSRVKTLEQRIQSRVPRMHKLSLRGGDSEVARRSAERVGDKTVTESPGWVLVTQEATPMKPQRGVSSPAPPSSFRPAASTSGLRPPSRVGSLSLSTSTNIRPVSSASSGRGPISPVDGRPVTPTLLPMPTTSDALGRSTRRQSLSASTSLKPPTSRARPNSSTMPSRPPLPSMRQPSSSSSSSSTSGHGKQPPPRPKSNLGMSTRHALSTSKIGRPNSLTGPPQRQGP